MKLEVRFLDTTGPGPKARLLEERSFTGCTRPLLMKKVRRRATELMHEHGLPCVGMVAKKAPPVSP